MSDLIGRLRCFAGIAPETGADGFSRLNDPSRQLIGDAADALEAKDAEIERLFARQERFDSAVADQADTIFKANARIEALERENAALRSAHHDATEGISGTLLRDRVEALEAALREARDRLHECSPITAAQMVRKKATIATIDALLTGGDK